MSIREIEAAIVKLPSSELTQLLAWIDDYREKSWDQQIESDLNEGRLDGLLAELNKEYEAGLARPL